MAKMTFRDAAAAFEDYLWNHRIPKVPENLYMPIRYALESGGKHLRPVLLILSCDACSGMVSKSLPAALAIEIFHNFTLVHDDIMDRATLRRGHPSVWGKWDTNAAVLSGDAMMILAYRALSEIKTPAFRPLFSLFNDSALAVCEGQQLDMDYEHRTAVSENEYFDMIGKKTAALIACAMEMGVICAGADRKVCHAYRKAGHRIGLAFQIRDDWLDLFGPAAFGKKIGGDIIEHKKTYLWIKAATRGKTAMDQLHAFQKIKDPDAIIDAHKRLYIELGIEEDCITEINRCIDEAGDILHHIRSADNTHLWPYVLKLAQRGN